MQAGADSTAGYLNAAGAALGGAASAGQSYANNQPGGIYSRYAAAGGGVPVTPAGAPNG
jgi:hypothetical protein